MPITKDERMGGLEGLIVLVWLEVGLRKTKTERSDQEGEQKRRMDHWRMNERRCNRNVVVAVVLSLTSRSRHGESFPSNPLLVSHIYLSHWHTSSRSLLLVSAHEVQHKLILVHPDAIWALSWTSLNHLVSGSADGRLRVYLPDALSNPLFDISPHPLAVTSISSSSDGKRSLSASLDGTVALVDLVEGTLLEQVDTGREKIGHGEGGKRLLGNVVSSKQSSPPTHALYIHLWPVGRGLGGPPD